MLQFVIVVSKVSDTTARADAVRDLPPLNARSLALSTLLGTHPPALPARAFVALAELFGIASGTMRTALSRLAAGGEIEAATGWYRLTGRLLERQQSQDIGRRPPGAAWDGSWHTVIAAADQRELAERRRFRAVLVDHRFGELRPDTWLRPANLPAPDLGDGAFVLTGTLDRADEPQLVARLWDLPHLAADAHDLLHRITELRATVDLTQPSAIPPTFTLAAAVLRFLRAEPLLPPSLVRPDWPVDELRTRYATLETDLQATLRAFLRSQRD